MESEATASGTVMSAHAAVTVQRRQNQTISTTLKREDSLRCSAIALKEKIKWLNDTSSTSMQASVTTTFLE
jgi:hypothetical protein